MREGKKANNAAQVNRKARGISAMPPLPQRRPVELLSPSPPKETLSIKSTPALSPSKSFTSNSSLPETPLSISSTLPSSPEVEVNKRLRAVPVKNRAFQMALKSAFSENQRVVSQDRVVTNQLSLELKEEDEPLIDLTEGWERSPSKQLSDLDLTVEKEVSPEAEAKEDKHTTENGTGSGKLSPWSKPFSPRTTAAFERHDTPQSGHPTEVTQPLHDFERGDDPVAIAPLDRPFAALSHRKRMHVHNLAYEPHSRVNTTTPYISTPTTPPRAEPSPNAFFVPPTPKSITLRAPEPLVHSPVHLPETPKKPVSVGNAACLSPGRIVLPYEDDYDSDDDPFFPAMQRPFYDEDSDIGHKKGITVAQKLEYDLESTSRDMGIDHDQTETLNGSGGNLESSGMIPKHDRFSSLGIGNHPKDIFGEKHDASVVSKAVLRGGLGGSHLPCSSMLGKESADATATNTASYLQWRDRVATEPSQHRFTMLSSQSPHTQSRQKSEYNFTICRAHLRNLACPYGQHCCFKHPPLPGPLDPESISAAERDMGWKEQARVNFGKIRGLLATGTCDVSEEDQASMVLLFADSVCQHAASHVEPLIVASQGLEKKDERAEQQVGEHARGGNALRSAGPPTDGSSPRAGGSPKVGVREFVQKSIQTAEESAVVLGQYRCSPPQQDDID